MSSFYNSCVTQNPIIKENNNSPFFENSRSADTQNNVQIITPNKEKKA